MVRHYIKDEDDEGAGQVGLSGENMKGNSKKGNGIYFVLAKYKDQLDSLREMLDELYPDSRAFLTYLPMADGASEREMIRRQHALNLLADMEDAMGDAASLLREDRDREVRSNIKSHHWNRLQQLRRRAADYATALQGEQEELTAHLDVLHRQLKKLTG
jgi:hypothetical protein